MDCYRKANDKGKGPYNQGHAYHASQEIAYDQEDDVGRYKYDHSSNHETEVPSWPLTNLIAVLLPHGSLIQKPHATSHHRKHGLKTTFPY